MFEQGTRASTTPPNPAHRPGGPDSNTSKMATHSSIQIRRKTNKRRLRKEYARSLQAGTDPDYFAALPDVLTGPLTIHDGTATNTPSIILIPPPNSPSLSSQDVFRSTENGANNNTAQESEDEVFDSMTLFPPPLGNLGRLDTNVDSSEYPWMPPYLIEKDKVEREERLRKRELAEMDKKVKDHQTKMAEGLFEGEKKAWAKKEKYRLRSERDRFRRQEEKRRDKKKEILAKEKKKQEKV